MIFNDIKLISIQQSAQLLGVNPLTVRLLITRQYIPSIRIGPKTIRLFEIDVLLLRKQAKETYSDRLSYLARTLIYPSLKVSSSR